jgi:hypothetical protein
MEELTNASKLLSREQPVKYDMTEMQDLKNNMEWPSKEISLP